MTTESFILRIGHRPNEREARELLEVVLAGASLNLDLDVLFQGAAAAFLEDEAAAQWRQLLDHDLARIWYCADRVGSKQHRLPATLINARRRDRLLDGRAVIDL